MFKFLKDTREETKIPQCSEDTPNTNEKNIGEPVISFVKLLEEQPENFLWKRDIKKNRGRPSVLGINYLTKRTRRCTVVMYMGIS